MRVITIILSVVLAAIGAAPVAYAQEKGGVTVTAGAEVSSVSVGESFNYQIAIEGSTEAEPLSIPAIPGTHIEYSGPQQMTSSETSIINGQRVSKTTVSILHQYVITPTKVGELIIPSIDVIAAGKAFKTNSVRVQVSDATQAGQADGVRFRLDIDAESVTVGQPVTLRATFYLSRVGNGMPLFEVPLPEGAFEVFNPERVSPRPNQLAFDLLGSSSVPDQGNTVLNGVRYDTFTVERVLVPRTPGTFAIGPGSATIQVATRQQRAMFERVPTKMVKALSNPLTVKVSALPEQGRPSNFSGLVGRYAISTEARPTEVSVGDPVAVTVTVRGPKPVERIPEVLSENTPGLAGNFRLTPDATKPRDNTDDAVIFSRTLRPATDAVKEIPALELNYYDPIDKAYHVARSAPIPLKVRPTRVVTATDGVGAAEAPATSGMEIEDLAGGLAANKSAAATLVDQRFDLAVALRSPVTIAAVAAPPVAYAGALLLGAVRRRSGSDAVRRRARALPNALSILSGANAANHLGVSESVSNAIRSYLADTHGQEDSGVSMTPEDVARLLASRSPELAERASALLSRCDAARFAGDSGQANGLREEGERLLRDLAVGVRR